MSSVSITTNGLLIEKTLHEQKSLVFVWKCALLCQ